MQAVSECAKLPTLFLLILTLASQECQGSPRGRREAGAQGDKEKLFHLFPPPVSSSSAGRVRSSSQPERVVYAATSSSPSSVSEPQRDHDRALLFSVSSSTEPARSWIFSVPRSADILPRDLNLKEKFIKHFTGPVTFSAECSKHFHRLYHNTRDCTIPAYYKRCARLLTRLAVSPLCTQP
ncbi:ALK and LTK ligand 1 [Trichosurus vulpecula]|uniref:ALK and LTK ligand 1 n=1 Tax=Trichosurus vulpecula TaxID=9337 RepID=UPI00186B0C61|nr:ALK and LTK ligand 1 [Trichosurus vulpecula]